MFYCLVSFHPFGYGDPVSAWWLGSMRGITTEEEERKKLLGEGWPNVQNLENKPIDIDSGLLCPAYSRGVGYYSLGDVTSAS